MQYKVVGPVILFIDIRKKIEIINWLWLTSHHRQTIAVFAFVFFFCGSYTS